MRGHQHTHLPASGKEKKCPKCHSGLLFLSAYESLGKLRFLSDYLEAKCSNPTCEWEGFWDSYRGELMETTDFLLRYA